MKELLSLFFVVGLIYAIVRSPEKRLTSAVAFTGLLIGIFAAVTLEKMTSMDDNSIIGSAVVQLPCVLSALYHSLKARHQTKPHRVQA